MTRGYGLSYAVIVFVNLAAAVAGPILSKHAPDFPALVLSAISCGVLAAVIFGIRFAETIARLKDVKLSEAARLA